MFELPCTMKSSLKMRAVNEMDTICRNSFSKSTRDIIMIAAPRGLYDDDEIALKKEKRTLV